MAVLVLLLPLLASAPPVAARPADAQQALRSRVETLRNAPATQVRGVRLLHAGAVAAFFSARRFKPAWTTPAAAESLVRAIRDIERDGLTPSDYHLSAIERAISARSRQPSAALEADLQLLIADSAAALVDHVRYGKVRPVTLDRRWNVDPRAAAPPLKTVLDGLARAPALAEAIEALKPTHFIYTGLKKELVRARALAAAGGWPLVPSGPTLEPGARDPRLVAIRRRLAASGELPKNASLQSDLYDRDVEEGVALFQERHRLAGDAVIGTATLDAMNMSATWRVQQLRANLERARWVVGGLQNTFLLVNLPAYEIYYIRGGKTVWESRVQIGDEARATPTFRADLRSFVFNPDWTVPPTILAKDVLEGMRKDRTTLEKKGLKIIDRQGRTVDPKAINWARATPASFPYTLRQPPGPDNALGRVKFVLPNPYTIYLHDTPTWDLFVTNQRTFSSGCIRVEYALELASAILAQEGWTPARVQAAVDKGKTATVRLKKPVPIIIVYWTVSIGASGEARFAEDVYGRDFAVVRALDPSAQRQRAARR